MRISGTEPSSVILSQTLKFKKLKINDLKESKQAEAKSQNYNFNQFNADNFDALKRYESTEIDRRTWLYVPSRTLWSTSSDTHQVVEIYRETSTKMYTPFLIRFN